MASSYVFYVIPEHRGRAALAFLDWTDKALEVDGATAIIRTVRPGLDYSRTLARFGYTRSETAWVKRVVG
jgi:hypothetical protein